jgi:hypothetical protein
MKKRYSLPGVSSLLSPKRILYHANNILLFLTLTLTFTTLLLPKSSSPLSNFNSRYNTSQPDILPSLLHLESHFSSITTQALSARELAYELKQAELAIADIATAVKLSELPGNDREALVSVLEKFVVDAKGSGKLLARFAARVKGVEETFVTAPLILHTTNRIVSMY